jgi:predicted amidohydrolase YtcJ
MEARAFVGGRILTMDPALVDPEVLIIEHGRIKAVGPRGLLDRYPDAEIHPLGDRTLLPGFVDSHNHVSIAALHPRWADLSAVRTLGELEQALQAQAKAEPDAPWVRGVLWDELQSDFPLTCHELDRLGIDRPIIVVDFSYHQCVVSSAGLDALGIGRSTRDPEGGEIARGPDGEPTGLLVERAWSEAQACSVAAYTDGDRWGDWIEQHARSLLRHGITCAHDAACSPEAEAVYRELASSGRLPISILSMPHPGAWFSAPPRERLEGPVTGEGDERFRIGPMKFFADGGAHPAVEVALGEHRVTLGHLFPDLTDTIAMAVDRGFRVAVHAMGNRGVESALRAFEWAARMTGGEDPRFRLEHATLVAPQQMKRLASLGVIGVVQPGMLEPFGRYRERGLLPPLEELKPLAFQELRKAGVMLAASSDHPCAELAPLHTSCFGVTRRTSSGFPLEPEQGIDYEEWLRAYTQGAAYAGGQESERGTLTPGKRADLVVVEGKLEPEGAPRVVETWVEGELLFAADGEPSG